MRKLTKTTYAWMFGCGEVLDVQQLAGLFPGDNDHVLDAHGLLEALARLAAQQGG